jgi:vacuolar-type H+-ATPase subunit F/Vma7
MRLRVVTRSRLATGFELAGLMVTRADDEVAAAEVVKRLAAQEEVGIILIDDVLFRALPRELLARLERQALPVLAPVPPPRWDERSEAEAYILDILRRAIGYRVRPR